MQCTACGCENPAGNKFCGKCGAALPRRCTVCGTVNPAENNFCGNCGASLAAAPTAPAPDPAPVHHPPAAERRQLTVMFCDLVGSTALSARLDPEELREVLGAYQSVCAAAIEADEGYVAQYLGDGVLAYFGYPRAMEREAGRAVRAGLRVLREVRRLSERLEKEQGIAPAVRIGIHTGVVVVGEIGAGQRREQLALGETPNLAARIQSIAAPDTLLVSADTYRLVHDEFECEDLGPHRVAGLGAPVRLYSVSRDLAGELVAQGRRAAPPPVVGRNRELTVLRERWKRVQAGAGGVVLLAGEAGIGKSTLAHAFADVAASGGATLLETRCLPYFRSTAYQPVVELLYRTLGCAVSERPEQKLSCLGGLLERRGLDVEETMPLFAEVLSIPWPGADGDGADPARARRRREKTRESLLRLLLAVADDGPFLLSVEDLHWADPSTLELLGLLIAEAPARPMLALFTHRPEFQPPWGEPPFQSRIELTRLPEREVQRIIRRLTGGRALPPEVVRQIVARTDGVPLFVEELTRTVLESGLLREENGRFEVTGGALPPLAIPATLQDSLEARLDRLAATRELAQIGAVLGREFSYELVRAVSGMDEPALGEALSRLVEAELVFQSGLPPDADYTFRHALIQEAAYGSLLRGVRQTWHQRTALVLEERFPDVAAAHPERVAQHYTAAGLVEPAVDAWLRSGRRALERSACEEAEAHLREGLELLVVLPPGPARDERELALRLALAPTLTATRGHADAEVRALYLRALELSRALGNVEDHLEIMGGLFAAYAVRGEMEEAGRLAREMLRAAAADGSSRWEGPATVAVGIALLKTGAFAQAAEHLERGIARYEPARDFALAHVMGQDWGVVAWCYSAFTAFARGAPDDALRRVLRAAELARTLDHQHTLAFALSFNTSIRFFRREPEPALAAAAELEELTRREGFRQWGMDVPPIRGWALAGLDRLDEARAVLEPIGADLLVEGMEIGPAMHRYRIIAEAFLLVGRVEEARAVLDRLRTLLEAESPAMWWRADVCRAEAAALLALGREDEARAHLEMAVEMAGTLGTPVFRLRALVDLARLGGELDPALRAELEAGCRALCDEDERSALRDLRDARALLAAAAAGESEPTLVPA